MSSIFFIPQFQNDYHPPRPEEVSKNGFGGVSLPGRPLSDPKPEQQSPAAALNKEPPKSESSGQQAEPAAEKKSSATPAPASEPELPSNIGQKTRSRLPNATRDRIAQLKAAKHDTAGRKERAAINEEIRELQRSREQHRQNYEFKDVQRRPIGRVIIGGSARHRQGAIRIADQGMVESIRFDFVKTIDGREVLLRTTALLSPEANHKLEKFIERHLKKIYRSYDPGKRAGQKRMSKADLRRELQHKKSYQLKISGFEAILSLKGRVQILTSLQKSENIKFVSLNEAPRRFRSAFSVYTGSTPYKAWVSRTNNDFNRLVAGTFKALSKVLEEVLT